MSGVNGLFHDIVEDVNFMGRVREGIKRNLMFGVDKLRRDVLPLCREKRRESPDGFSIRPSVPTALSR